MQENTGKIILFSAVGCLLGFACCVLIGFAGFGGLAWLGLQEPEDVTIIGEVSGRATVGETFTITVTVENVGAEVQSLDSIDIDASYLEGVYILSSKPTFVNREDLSVLGFEFESFDFVEMIRSGEVLTVEFAAEALQAGVFEGEIDVCINTGSLCKSLPAYTIIEE